MDELMKRRIFAEREELGELLDFYRRCSEIVERTSAAMGKGKDQGVVSSSTNEAVISTHGAHGEEEVLNK